jgi:ABC-type glycerol-3-phosphate transport system substrate-binding protein
MEDNNMKRFFSLAALLALGVSLTFAGGGGQQNSASAANRTITINTGASTGAEAGWQAVAQTYMKLHPDVTVVVDLKPDEGYGDWVQNIFTTANPTADIIGINMAGATAAGKAINFLEYADQKSPYSNGKWTDQFNFATQTRNLAKGEWHSLSLYSVKVFWLYNKDIFAKVGVEPPKTWDELIAVCQKLQAAGYQPISLAGDYNSFWSGAMGWLAQGYADQTTRSLINVYRAQPGDYCYDPDIDGVWKYNPLDGYNDDPVVVTTNPVRVYKAIAEGQFAPDSQGMRTVWQNIAKVFPVYAGGDAFFGTLDATPLFYQGKAAMTINGGWTLMQFRKDMAKIASGQTIESDGKAISGVSRFELGTFDWPTMDGPGIEAPVRSLEGTVGFLGAVKKDRAHDNLVVDFLMYFSSKEGQSVFLNAAIANDYGLNGPSLVYGVELPPDIQSTFDSLPMVGGFGKSYGSVLARGMKAGNEGGDIHESYRVFYDYSYNYLSGRTTVDQWLVSHKANVMRYLDQAMMGIGISRNDLNNPQNAPTGQ